MAPVVRGCRWSGRRPGGVHLRIRDHPPRPFHERYPDIELDIRDVRNVSLEQASGADIMLVLGWPPKIEDWAQKTIGAGRFLVVASPAYWATHGIPQRPGDLKHHSCMPIRALDGTVMDLWSFRRRGLGNE